MSGLDAEQEAIIVASGTHGRTGQNFIEDVWAEIFDISQPSVSRIITEIPLIEKATAEFRPDAEEAKAAARSQTVLVDGFLAPCWSCAEYTGPVVGKAQDDWLQQPGHIYSVGRRDLRLRTAYRK